jgi:hypothetical protein
MALPPVASIGSTTKTWAVGQDRVIHRNEALRHGATIASSPPCLDPCATSS